jgi:ubiquinone/menaquinone biosynthesis C-methylase UbiE
VFTASAQGVHPKSGRRIAGVMGVGGADWLERIEREREEAPTKAIELLGLKPGMVVADVGAGVGYYATRMAKKVGPTGKIYANDIQAEMLTLLRKRVAEEKLANIEMVLGTETDPKLPKGELDLIIMVDVYHEFAQPQRMLRKLKECLKPDGRLVLLEFRKEDPYVPIRTEHKMSITEAKLELEDEGFVLEKVLHDLPWQHMLFFKKATP